MKIYDNIKFNLANMSLVIDNKCVKLLSRIFDDGYRIRYGRISCTDYVNSKFFNIIELYEFVKDSYEFHLSGCNYHEGMLMQIKDFENNYVVFVINYCMFCISKQQFVNILEQFAICSNILKENDMFVSYIETCPEINKFKTIDEYKQYTIEQSTTQFYPNNRIDVIGEYKSNEIIETILSKCPDFCFEVDENN